MGVEMTFDFGEVLSRAWQLTWKHKVLWIIGLVFGVLVSAMFLLLIIPAFLPVLLQNSRTNLTPVILFLAGFGIVFLLFVLALYPISVLTQTSLTLGILDANDGNEPLSVRELVKKSLPFFWRVLGLMVLFAVGVGLINLVIQVVIILLTVVTLGIAT